MNDKPLTELVKALLGSQDLTQSIIDMRGTHIDPAWFEDQD